MRMRLIQIQNFRALENIELEFQPMTVIIGENDVGKSSCMLAMRAFFESKKFENDADYFQHDKSRPITIDVTFDCPEPTDDQRAFVHERRLQCRCVYPFNEAREIHVKSRVPGDTRFRDLGTQPVDQLRTTLAEIGAIKATDKPAKAEAQRVLAEWININVQEFEESWTPMKETEFGKLVPDFILVPVGRSLESNLKMTEGSLLGKLFRPLLAAALRESEADESLRRIQGHLKECVREKVDLLQTLLAEQLNNDQIRLTHQVDVDPIKGVSFDFGMDDERVRNIPLANRGAGVHNNLILSMFRLLASEGARNFILAIEEPENSLHPRGQREMLWALQGVARTAQVICTTHSSVFLDLGRLEDNIVLSRTARGNTIPRSFAVDDHDQLRELMGIRISDALLSGGGNCAIIVEGATESQAYPSLFRIAGWNPRALGISIVNAEGSDFERIRRLLIVLNTYRIPSVVVLDSDARKAKEDLDRLIREETMPCLRKVFCLKLGQFEQYIPLEIAAKAINQLYPDGKEVRVEDFDAGAKRVGELNRVVYAKKGPGVRIEYFKVRFGERAGRLMLDSGCLLPPEIQEIVAEVKAIATEI